MALIENEDELEIVDFHNVEGFVVEFPRLSEKGTGL